MIRSKLLKHPFKAHQFLWLILPVLTYACQSKNGNDISVYKVKKGTFQIEITEEGDVDATNSINISTPNLSSWRYGNLKISSLVTDGSKVEKGDTVVTFDPSEVNKAIVESESTLEINKAELERTQAQHESEVKDLMSDYEVTRINKEISQIKFENSDYYSEIERKKIKLNLEKAEIELEKALDQIENRKKIQREEIAQKKLAIEQAKSQLDEAKNLGRAYSCFSEPGYCNDCKQLEHRCQISGWRSMLVGSAVDTTTGFIGIESYREN